MEFVVNWNPFRAMRKHHGILIRRGIISEDIDKSKLINKDSSGKACYLCPKNIRIQNPKEILLKIKLADEDFYAGANFAYITNNHFTIMNSEHLKQIYRRKILSIMLSFVEKTKGYFRIIYNGTAGASIKRHEHLQATTEKFPVESIKKSDCIYCQKQFKIFMPDYYIPLYLLESENKETLIDISNKIIKKWHSLSQNHTENLIFIKENKKYRLFIILRDKTKLSGKGKRGAIASFEAGGTIVFSCRPEKDNKDEIDERKTFENADLSTIKQLLKSVAPKRDFAKKLNKKLNPLFS